MMPASDDQYTLPYDAKARCHDVINDITVLPDKGALPSNMTITARG